MSNKHKNIDFDTELTYGDETYNRKVGLWWQDQANNKAHDKAYKDVVRNLKKNYKDRKPPKVIIDFACGAGNLLWRLVKAFPDANIYGIDGSSKMLDKAEARLHEKCTDYSGQVELIESDLPNFEIEVPKADLIVFCFPNICPRADDQAYYDEHGYMVKCDRKVAKALGKAREKDPEDETCTDTPEEVMNSLLDAKVIARNLRHLLKKNGRCCRVEYAQAKRKELTELVRMRCSFGMGSLDKKFKGTQSEQIYKLLKSTYIISDVIEDVYHQTKDREKVEGGFHINLLKAL